MEFERDRPQCLEAAHAVPPCVRAVNGSSTQSEDATSRSPRDIMPFGVLESRTDAVGNMLDSDGFCVPFSGGS